jgi:hypothetical protein
MRTLLRIAYWPLAIAILAVILVSLDYSLAQAVLIALMFCPCALVLEFWMPKARKPMDKFFLLIYTESRTFACFLCKVCQNGRTNGLAQKV